MHWQNVKASNTQHMHKNNKKPHRGILAKIASRLSRDIEHSWGWVDRSHIYRYNEQTNSRAASISMCVKWKLRYFQTAKKVIPGHAQKCFPHAVKRAGFQTTTTEVKDRQLNTKLVTVYIASLISLSMKGWRRQCILVGYNPAQWAIAKVKAGVLRPVQQPGPYWDRFSAPALVGLEPTGGDSLWLDAKLVEPLGHGGPRQATANRPSFCSCLFEFKVLQSTGKH